MQIFYCVRALGHSEFIFICGCFLVGGRGPDVCMHCSVYDGAVKS
ncbi:hypothetical protein BPUTSESOX_1515 [uncultured Gammaproteobacteria bacterium]|nr:hypothetical protein BPUTSESOX_1515 [uncultured Gammaproteobacteria bacterium]